MPDDDKTTDQSDQSIKDYIVTNYDDKCDPPTVISNAEGQDYTDVVERAGG